MYSNTYFKKVQVGIGVDIELLLRASMQRCLFLRPFSGVYVGYGATPGLKTYFMTVRDLMLKVKTDIVPAMTDLVKLGVITEHYVNKTLCHHSHAKDFVAGLLPIIKGNPEKLHKAHRG